MRKDGEGTIIILLISQGQAHSVGKSLCPRMLTVLIRGTAVAVMVVLEHHE